MPAGVSSNTTIQAQTKVIEKAYLSETDRVPAQYKTIIPDLTSDERRRFVTYLPYAGLSAFQEKIEGAAPAFDAPFEMIPFTAVYNTYALAATVTEAVVDVLEAFEVEPERRQLGRKVRRACQRKLREDV